MTMKPGRAPDYRDRDYTKKPVTATMRIAVPTRTETLIRIVKRYIDDGPRAAAALRELHDSKLYTEKYGTFENLCLDEFGISVRHGYRLIEAEHVKETVECDQVVTEKINENQARALKSAPPEQRAEVLKIVAKTGPVTAKRIAAVVTSRKKSAPVVIDVEPEPEKITKRNPCLACGGTGFAEKAKRRREQ